ncbi:MAG: VWA domain-containing protein, partial [Victivallaceae bacterium]
MNFLNVELWYLLPLAAAILIVFGWLGCVKRKKILKMYLGRERAQNPAFVIFSPEKRWLRNLLLGVVWLLLFIAAARPWWGNNLVDYESGGRDVMIVFDVSKSMLASDVAPNRLEHAKMLVREIVQEHPGDRFGLIAFAGSAFISCPLTSDSISFDEYLKELGPDAVPVGGTNLEAALKSVLRGFDAAAGNDKAVIIFTDGEELTGDATAVLNDLKRSRIKLLVVGIG